MSKYLDDVKLLLEYIGGKENVQAVSHCVTRMRFVLKDNPPSENVEKIESLNSVKGTFTQAGQFQIIIGTDVINFYNEFIKYSGIDGVNSEQIKKTSQTKMNKLQKLMAALAEIFSPLIPAIIVGGLILGFRNIIGDIKLLEDGTKTIVESSQFFAGLHSFLWLIGEAIFHFLPVGITWSISKKMGTTQILGIVLGITLVSPQLLNAYSVGTGAEIPFWDFGFAKINMIGYQAQVIPAMLAGFLLSYLEIFLRKFVPQAISMIVIPFFSLIPTVLVAHVVLGPIGWKIGDFISNIVYNGLTSSYGFLFAGVFGFLYAPLVITGLHHMTNPIDLQLISLVGGTSLWPMVAISNIAQGSAVLAMIYVNRKNKEERQVSVPACISCYLGVTEPAIFGINLKYGFPFISAMIGSAVASVFIVYNKVMATAIGIGGLPGILSIQPQYMFKFFIGMILAIGVTFILTVALSRSGKFKLKK